MPTRNPGPPPPMPPHGSADPDSPNYNPERARMQDEMGMEAWDKLTQDWQRWAAQEDEYIGDAIAEGMRIEDIPSPWNPNERYENVHEKGKNVFDRYGEDRQAQIQRDALNRLVRAGHLTWDPNIGLYRSGGIGEMRYGEDYRNEAGQRVGSGSTAQARNYGGTATTPQIFGTGTAYGGQATAPPPAAPPANTPTGNAADRPYLNTPNSAYDRGWSRYLGHGGSSPSTRRPVSSTSPFGDVRQGGVTDPNNPFYSLPGRTTGYIPGLSPTQ